MNARELMRRYGELVVPLVLAVGFPIELLQYRRTDAALALPIAWAMCLVLIARRKAPLAVFTVIVALNVGLDYAAPGYHHASVFYIAAFVYALYSLGAYLSGRAVWVGAVLVLVAVIFSAIDDGDTSPVGYFFFLMFLGVPWGLGVAVRLRREKDQQLRQQEAAAAVETARAITEERARIARELHDVVSHAIAVTVLQSRGARRMVGHDEGAVRRALSAIEQTNTSALADMRRLLALLRDADDDGRAEPAPSLERLDDLIDQVRHSGLDVDLEVSGEPLPVAPGLDLSAYRIVQEALTNVLKHAGPHARAQVRIDYRADDLAVSVTNTGATSATGHGGHGLIGLRERVAVAGGSLEVGPRDDGFAVHARLPYLVETIA